MSSRTTSNIHAVTPSVPQLPESAPFSASQRAWLNGFLAGMLGGAPASHAKPQATLAAVEEVEEFPWHDSSLSLEERLKLAEGHKPERLLMAAMAQLDCGSCGYVCQSYAEAIASGADKDLTKCSPGGAATMKKLKELVVTLNVNGKPSAAPLVASTATPATAAPTRDRPAVARLLVNRPLNGPGSAKDTRHIEIDLRGTGVTYKVGDALGVWPENDVQLVRRILDRLGCVGSEDVASIDGTHTSCFDALLRQRVITSPSESLIELLIGTATDAGEADRLQSALLDDGGHPFSGLHVLDLLELAPSATPGVEAFVESLGRLQPRLYSISSSPVAHAGRVHLTVGTVRFTNKTGRSCGGVASTYLADRVVVGDQLRVFAHPSKHFGLPPDPSTPIIMVGPGTGIAPFRAFLHERIATHAAGDSWLFFGDQKSACDFLYRDELEAMLAGGKLTRLDLAFSRDQAEKVYVQDRMREHGRDLWQWLERGAHLYICGDASRMAKDVEAALIAIAQQHGARGEADAKAYVKKLATDGRYQKDVY